jgi:hypothetical protein
MITEYIHVNRKKTLISGAPWDVAVDPIVSEAGDKQLVRILRAIEGQRLAQCLAGFDRVVETEDNPIASVWVLVELQASPCGVNVSPIKQRCLGSRHQRVHSESQLT